MQRMSVPLGNERKMRMERAAGGLQMCNSAGFEFDILRKATPCHWAGQKLW